MQRADAFDPERFIRLQEAAFNLAARIQDFTVFCNLFAARGTITRCSPGQTEVRQDVWRATTAIPPTAVYTFRTTAGDHSEITADYVGSGWPEAAVRGRATFTLDDACRVTDLRLEEHPAFAAAQLQRSAVLAQR